MPQLCVEELSVTSRPGILSVPGFTRGLRRRAAAAKFCRTGCARTSRTGRLLRPAGEYATMGATSDEEPDMTKFLLLQNYAGTAACDLPMTDWAPGDIKAHIDFQLALNADLAGNGRSEEHTSELQSQFHLVCRLLLE